MLNTKLYTVDCENPMKYTNVLFKTVWMIDVAMHSHACSWNKEPCKKNNNNDVDNNNNNNNGNDDDDDDNNNNNNNTFLSFSSKWMFVSLRFSQ